MIAKKKILLRLSLLMASLLIVIACSEIKTPGEVLRISTSSFKDAYIEENYDAIIRVIGGLSPYSYELDKGQLPEGLRLENGRIVGIPTAEGRVNFTIVVSDANLSKTFQDYSLNVINPPPAELDFRLPQTEMRERFSIRPKMNYARHIQGFRTLITWDKARFSLAEDSIKSSKAGVAMVYQLAENSLALDIVALGEAFNGQQELFSFDLIPLEASTVSLQARTEFRSSEGKHSFQQVGEPFDTDTITDITTDTTDDATNDATNDPLDPDAIQDPDASQETKDDANSDVQTDGDPTENDENNEP